MSALATWGPFLALPLLALAGVLVWDSPQMRVARERRARRRVERRAAQAAAVPEAPVPNAELLRATLAAVEASAGDWDQGTWAMRSACGTAGCFALHAIRIARPDAEPWFREGFDATAYVRVDGMTLDIPEFAQRLLGLSPSQADRLFAPRNTRADLRRLVAELAGGGRDA